MLTRYDIQRLLKLLKQEVYPAVGCNEPLAIALACAKARELLGEEPDKVVARLSSTIIMNSVGIGIPGAEGMIGIAPAIALGTVAGRAEAGLDVLSHIGQEEVAEAKRFMTEKTHVVKHAPQVFEILYIEVEATVGVHSAKVIMAKSFTNFVFLKHDDEVLLDERHTLATEHDRRHESELTMQTIYDFATKCPLDELQFLLKGARMNKDVAQHAFTPEANYGLNLGKMLKGGFQERMVGQNAMPRLVCYTCAACDVRMSGARVPVMTNSGSGNQGIAVTLPVMIFAEETQCTEAKQTRALAMSHLINIYIRQIVGKLSSHCNCVLACVGSACGIAYLLGGSFEQVCHALKNDIASKTGMICDGVKPSCTLKMSMGVSSAFQSAMMAMEGICVSVNDGIIVDDPDRCIENLAIIGRDSKNEIDSQVLNIMSEKIYDNV